MIRRLFLILFSISLAAQAAPLRIAILKVDDVWGPGPKWDRCFQTANDLGIKVSAGIVADSLEKQDATYVAWLKKWEGSGKVEFWSHGWDHKRWTEEGKEKSEFSGTGYDSQIEHLKKAQQAFKTAMGRDFTTFGSPFNAMDQDTVKAVAEIPELKMIFSLPDNAIAQAMSGKILLPMNLRGEHGGTGKPDFALFKEDYAKRDNPKLEFAAIQFHPANFTEKGFEDFTAILRFLKEQGWTFMLPSEYREHLAKKP